MVTTVLKKLVISNGIKFQVTKYSTKTGFVNFGKGVNNIILQHKLGKYLKINV